MKYTPHLRRAAALLLALTLLSGTALAKPLNQYTDHSAIQYNAARYANPTEYLGALQRISDLGIMGANASYDDGELLTRAELMTALITFMNGFPLPQGTVDSLKFFDSPFTDVTPDKWYYSHILYAHATKLTNGVGGGRMNPEGRVPYIQALLAIMNLLGNRSERSGLAYERLSIIVFAHKQFNLVRDFLPRDEAALTRGELAVLFSYALEAVPITYDKDDRILQSGKTHGQSVFKLP